MSIENLAARIRRDGPVSVADYMAISNNAYYGRAEVIGRGGDFITAPEISQTFGEMIGLWCAVTWQAMGSPTTLRLVECGPGRGTLMADLLRAGNILPGFSNVVDVHLVERSEALRAQQRAKLGGRAVTWHSDMSTVPRGPMILVANEFLDALPIRQFEKTADGWMERCVTVDAQARFEPTLARPLQAPTAPHTAEHGAVFETSPAVADFIAAVSRRVAIDGGAALFFDYGHKQSALGDTLQAVKAHKYCGVFEHPGAADLTAHVDFQAVAETARGNGAKVFGPLEQGTWLANAGIKIRGAKLAAGKPGDTAKAIEAGIQRLTAPDAMGALFKVIAIGHTALARLDGFQQDAPP